MKGLRTNSQRIARSIKMIKKADKKTCMMVGIVFFILLGITNATFGIVRTAPFEVVLIGQFISSGLKGDNKIYELWTGEEKWQFKVNKIRLMGSASVTGWRLLSEIVPRRIKLLGSDQMIKPLRQPEIEGKKFKLRGRLYINSRSFHLNRAEEVLEDKPAE